MGNATAYALVLLALLAFKHVIADYVLQSGYMLENRKRYGHPGGLLHVAIHTAGTALAVAIAGAPSAGVLVIVLTFEALVHYHIDWAKDNLVERHALTPRDARYWYLAGTDQGLHHLTYVAMTAYLVIAQFS